MIQLIVAGVKHNRVTDADDAEDWSPGAAQVTDLPGMSWTPTMPGEQPAVDGTPISETGTVSGRRHTITEANRIRIPGLGDFTVTGVQQPVRSPLSLQSSPMVISVRRIR